MRKPLATVPIERLPGVSPLFRDACSRAESPLHDMLGGSRCDARVWERVLAGGAKVDPRVVTRLKEFNASLGAPASLLDRIGRLGNGTARAVVTGQQPGVLGGPLLTLYKIASSVALARTIEATRGVPCVPVFWLGSDDDDFAEIRDLVAMGADVSVAQASLAVESYRPGLRIGDIPAAAALTTWKAIAPLVASDENARRVETVVAPAADFAVAAARVVTWVTQGAVVVVDGREPVLRECAAKLLLDFFDAEEKLRGLIDAQTSRLETSGYHVQLRGGEDSGLFLVKDGIRRRVPAERRAAARAEFAADITRISPGVVARNILQDSVLAPAAVVLGPAEIAYRAQLTGVYHELSVPMPIVVPRLMATFAPAPVRELIDATGIDPALLVTDLAAFVRAAEASARDAGFAAAAQQFEDSIRREAAAFALLARGRMPERAAQKIEKRLAEVTQRLAQALAGAVEEDGNGARSRWPFLARLAGAFVREGEPQERFLSLLTPHLAHGFDAWKCVEALADSHVRDSLDGRVWHGVYSV